MNSQRSLTRAATMLADNRNAVLFVSPLLRTREIKLAQALRQAGWTVVLIYTENTPFTPESFFDLAIRARSEEEAHSYAMQLQPRVCHAFSGAVDELLVKLCNDKPGPLVIDMNDVFCPSLFNYCEERFEPTRECLAKADALCARDLQARFAARFDGFTLPQHTLLFPEYTWAEAPGESALQARFARDDISIVSVGTFSLENQGMYDSCYLRLAELLVSQGVHFHIYPHWFYKSSETSSFNWNPKIYLAEFYELEAQTPYLHVHDSVSLDVLREELPAYDFGLISGGCAHFAQRLQMVNQEYMDSCYSGRIADYLDARMPVLINREVHYNFRLLRHYGIGVDLHRVVRPGFRDFLREVKRDREQARRVERAAELLSLRRHASRLARFYRQLIDEFGSRSAHGFRYPRWWPAAKTVPVIGRSLRRHERDVGQLHRTIDNLRLSAVHHQQQLARIRAEKEQMVAQTQQEIQEREQLLAQARHENENLSHQLESMRATVCSLNETNSKFRRGLDRALIDAAKALRRIRTDPISADLVSGLLNWPEIAIAHERANGLGELLNQMTLFSNGMSPLNCTSAAWDLLARKNFDELLSSGYRNFKRTIARNYFTFMIQDGDPQIRFLESVLGSEISTRYQAIAANLSDDRNFDLPQQAAYRYFVLLLWEYAQTVDCNRYLARLEEPEEGNPIALTLDGRRMSQDLINSVLEYYSMSEATDFLQAHRVLEIGGGYGRTSFVVAFLNPASQCTLVDVPPALYIAQRYLSAVFPDRRVFKVRDFSSYDEVKDEIDEASFVFLLPHQLHLLPGGRFSVCINISSFGEMQPEVIDQYFTEIDRLTRGVFYTKQWKVSKNPFDGVEIQMDQYPVKPGWRRVYQREARVQSEFFEAAYRIGRIGGPA